MTRALLEQALDALEDCDTAIKHLMQPAHPEVQITKTSATDVMKAIRAHLAKPQGEPSHQPLPRCIHCGRHPNDPKWDLTPVAPQAQPDKPLKERPDFIAGYMADIALTCDFCGCETPDPWHGNTATNRHVHACDACKPKLAPAWHDKPTAPGVWVVGSRCLHINELDLPIYVRGYCRWFGPVPDDGGKP